MIDWQRDRLAGVVRTGHVLPARTRRRAGELVASIDRSLEVVVAVKRRVDICSIRV